MTTVWVKLEALHPECKYTIEDEGKFSITINDNEKRKKVKYDSDWTQRCSQNQNEDKIIETTPVAESTSTPEETSLKSPKTSNSTKKNDTSDHFNLKTSAKTLSE